MPCPVLAQPYQRRAVLSWACWYQEASTVAPPAPAPPVLEPEPEPESQVRSHASAYAPVRPCYYARQEPERTEPEIEVGSEEAEVGSDMMEVEMPLPLAQPSFLVSQPPRRLNGRCGPERALSRYQVRGTPKFEDAVCPAALSCYALCTQCPVKPARPPAPAIDDPPVKLGHLSTGLREHAMSGTVIADGASCLRACYAGSGRVAVPTCARAMRCPVLP
eukprot:2319746-Rhodomonas_salina.2